uniref:Uncharacterized protein n=1 Tax=Anguilla anguilla TaxID=7936 RepID=A0A0E9S731_ANGAN
MANSCKGPPPEPAHSPLDSCERLCLLL